MGQLRSDFQTPYFFWGNNWHHYSATLKAIERHNKEQIYNNSVKKYDLNSSKIRCHTRRNSKETQSQHFQQVKDSFKIFLVYKGSFKKDFRSRNRSLEPLKILAHSLRALLKNWMRKRSEHLLIELNVVHAITLMKALVQLTLQQSKQKGLLRNLRLYMR